MSTPVRLRRCDQCAFAAVSVVQGYEALTCHRYAPQPLVGGSGTGWADYQWPVVCNGDFCGEFQPKDGDHA